MAPLSFRSRVSLTLVLLALPSAAGLLGWAYSELTNNPARAAQVVIAPLRRTGVELIRTIDTTRLTLDELHAFQTHREVLSSRLALSRRADIYQSRKTTGLAIILAVLGSVLFFLAIALGRSLTQQLSWPITELVGWAGHIQRGEPLPVAAPRRGAPEFAALRTALRDLAAGLAQARRVELESERLRAFREVSRRVAH